MLDGKLLAAGIASRAAWDRIAPHFQAKDLSPQAGFWFDLVRQWYTNDPNARAVDRSLLVELGKSKLVGSKHVDTLVEWMKELPDPPSAENVAQVALELKRQTVGMELASAIAGGDARRIGDLHHQYGDLMAATSLQGKVRSEWQAAVSVEQLFEKVGTENRVALSPLILNDRTDGGALPGHHIILFGRPEAGKSTMSINMAAGFAARGKRVVYIGNEDQIDVLKARMVSRVTNMTWPEVERDRAKAAALYRKRGGEELITMLQLKNGTMDVIQRKLDEMRDVDVLVLDQIRNIQGEGDSLTKVMEKTAIRLRSILLDYGLIGVSVTQANDRTERAGQEPPIWLSMSDIDSSRTGLPAQADLLIGVGVNSELDSKNQRALSLPKNKLSSRPNAHEGVIVTIDKSRSRIS